MTVINVSSARTQQVFANTCGGISASLTTTIRFAFQSCTAPTWVRPNVVEVFRISPEDAPSLIDEREESKKPNGRQKLAGTSLHHFGAFLDRVWRQNDIMWGRLDGAERLITALLPYPDDVLVRTALIREAHAAILREELSAESRRQLSALMSEALIRASSGEPIEDSINRVMKDLTDSSPVRTRLASAMTAIFDDDASKKDDDKLLTFVKLGYQVNRQLDPKSVLETISRSTQTIGGIFEDLANKNGLDGRSLSWIARLGQFFWGLVQVAVPNSILNKLATHWLYLLYMFEVVIILGGTILVRPGAQSFGWTALGITATINVLILLLEDLMRGRGAVKRALLLLGALALGSLALIGLLKLVGLFGFRVGLSKLPPLAWLSGLLKMVLDLAGPLRPYLFPILGLVIVAAVLVLLYRAGKIGSGRLARKPETFKNIKLQSFKKNDMNDIYPEQPAAAGVYSIPARLSAAPPPHWIKRFEDEWKAAHPEIQVKVYRDQLRFASALPAVSGIWAQLKTTIDSVNKAHADELDKLNRDLDQRQRNEVERRQQEVNRKWDILGALRK